MTTLDMQIDDIKMEFLAVHECLIQAILDNIKSRKELTNAILSANGKISNMKYNLGEKHV